MTFRMLYATDVMLFLMDDSAEDRVDTETERVPSLDCRNAPLPRTFCHRDWMNEFSRSASNRITTRRILFTRMEKPFLQAKRASMSSWDGDSPRNIHWKRSSILAENDFIVKEYSTNINKTVFIVVDTDWRGEKFWRLSRMSRIYAEMMSQGLACAEAGLTGQYIVWDMAKADIVRVTFYDNASLKAAVKVVMDIRCGEGTVNKACQALYEDDRLEITTEPVIITEN